MSRGLGDVYKRQEQEIVAPPVVDYVGKHADLAESFTIEIYGTVSQAVIDKINDLGVPLQYFPTTRVGFVRGERFA